MRRHPVLFGAIVAVVVAGAIVAAGAFSVPSSAVTVDGTSISRASLNRDLAAIGENQAFGCYLDASVLIRSANAAGLPPLAGTGSSGTYNTSFVDFWLSQQINNLLIERLAADQHLRLDATALSAGRADLVGSIGTTLAQAAAISGQSAVCAPTGASIIGTLPAAMVAELIEAQAAGDVVLAHAAGYGLTTAELARYYTAHADQFQTICLSVIETTSQAGAVLARAAVEGGRSFASVAQSVSTDSTSAANGGQLGCFSAGQGAYQTVAGYVKGLAVGQLSQPISNNGSYLVIEVTSHQPGNFAADLFAVRQAILQMGSTNASKELAALTKGAQVSIDPRYGRWSGARGIGIQPPRTPVSADLLNPKA